MRLTAIHAAVATLWTSIVQSSQIAPQTAANTSIVTLRSLHALMAADDEQAQGWWRAALALTDVDHALLLDILGATQLDQCQLRISALRDLPELNAIDSMEDIHTVIRAAVAIGAPRYNAGDVLGCCSAYWATMMTLTAAPVFRGFPGHARAMATLREIIERPIPPMMHFAPSLEEFAWQLRHALDAVMAIEA